MIPPSETCLCGHINWSLAQTERVFHGIVSVFSHSEGGKTRPQTGFHFTMQMKPVKVSSGASLAKRPHLESGIRIVQVARSLLVAVSPPVLPVLGEKGAVGDSAPHVLQSSSLLLIFICSFSGWYAFQIFRLMEMHYI